MADDVKIDRRIGNRFWEARSTHGRDLIFGKPEILWAACVEYFEWVDDNPLKEEKGFAFQGTVTKETFSKMRAMTMEGLCLFLDIGTSTWAIYRNRDDFVEVVTRVENVMRDQKFAGAAADLLNPNIIARDLGLKDASTTELNVVGSLAELIEAGRKRVEQDR